MKLFNKWAILLCLLCAPSVFVHTVIAEELAPKQVVETTLQSIVHVLAARSDQGAIGDEDREAIRKVIAGKFDYREMSRRSVGKTWKTMSDDKQVIFIDVFRQVLEYSYGNRLAGYHGQKLEFGDAEFKKGKARIRGAVVDSSKSIPMEYRLHSTATGWQVYDIKIEGVSMITTFRKDFRSILKKQGIDGLMMTLRGKIKKFKTKS